ncbi:GxxExxY protein [Phaeodactylibacter luteus]|uniref:GxxExxY protein n=1 Tax=Phaeodactylibacter luteus TaxID=1564516 RepID=A0A5C6RN27_9BACT|nr:GxxExxY protein [Phaeodactylibacter luteus]TXB63818.1 GxxExxY protein [Phaeodactylibacter luteus]
MEFNQLSEKVLGCAFKVHTALGPGLLESAYQACLAYELRQCGLFVEQEKAVPLVYEEVKLDCGYRIDLLVERKFVLELKAVDQLAPIHLAQVLTYLKLMNLRHGMLLNFNVKSLKNGIKRVVNGY